MLLEKLGGWVVVRVAGFCVDGKTAGRHDRRFVGPADWDWDPVGGGSLI